MTKIGGIGGIGGKGAPAAAVVLSVALCFASPRAQTSNTGEINLKATSANVKEPGIPVRVHLVRWSTDEERNPVVAALNPAPIAAPDRGDAAPAGRGGAAGRG